LEGIGKILIIKTGGTKPAMAARRGDFEDWILAGLGTDVDRTIAVDVYDGAILPSYSDVCGVVITGSNAMVTDHHDWSERTAAWLRGAVERDIPTLGICYGHQLLAYALGGEVSDNPNGLEVGTVEVHLNGTARADRLLAGFPSPIRVHAWHTQTVTRLPPDARRLASSAMDANHVFVVGDRIWGVQFHPEFDADIMIEFMRHDRQDLQKQGIDPQLLIQECVDTPHGHAVLRRFAEIIEEGGST
jgi:GMP synthase (glutamine-hydrolysing)